MNENPEPVAERFQWLQDRRILIGLILGLLFLTIAVIILSTMIFSRGVRLTEMEPDGEIGIQTNLTFSFSGDLVDSSQVGITTQEPLIRFSPEIPGKYRWLSQRELRFLPEVPFRPSTRYTAEIRRDLGGAGQRVVTGKRTIAFATQRFQLQESHIGFDYPEGKGQGLQLQARLRFNYPVDSEQLRQGLILKFEDTQKPVAYHLNVAENNQSFILTSETLAPEDVDRKLKLVVGKGLQCIGGNLGLNEDLALEAVLGAKRTLKIAEAVVKTDSTRCWIAVRCSQRVDAGSAGNFIRLDPAAPYRIESDGDYLYIYSERFKSGDSYQLRLLAGLPAANGYPLKQDFSAKLIFADLEPSLAFNTPGRYLSSQGFLNLGLETVNVERVQLEVSQIYANNLVNYLNDLQYDDYVYSYKIGRFGKVVYSDQIELEAAKNELMTTGINLQQYLSGFRGILQVVVCDDEHRWRRDSKYVIVTDLGIVSKMGNEELTVWVNSLENLAPKVRARVSLLSKNNQLLGEAHTDNQGIAKFKGIKQATAGFEPFMILAELEQDFSFVHFDAGSLATTDFDVQGRSHLLTGYEAFLYMDRDLFRPGDQGHLVALLRGPELAIPPQFPVKLVIRQPDGQIFKELSSQAGNRGAFQFKVEIPDYAQTGKYQVRLLVAEETVGAAAFSVEEFMPERIKVTTQLDGSRYSGGDQAVVRVEGVQLFGPPAADRRVSLEVTLEPQPFQPKGYADFSFGDPDQPFTLNRIELGEKRLDGDGKASFTYTFPGGLTPPAKLRAIFQGTVIEDGGRAVSSYCPVEFHTYARYIGVRPLSDYYSELGRPYRLNYVVLDTEGHPVNQPRLRAEVYHMTWNSLYRRNAEGRYEYVSELERNLVWQEELTVETGEPIFTYTPQEYGEYQIVLTDGAGPSRTTARFYASGWGYVPWTMEKPAQIQLESARKQYRPGEQAEIQIKAPFSGKALVTVEREKIYETQVVELKENTALIKVPVKEEYRPNVYVSVHLIRPLKSLEQRAPVRAFGVIPLNVDCSESRLPLKLEIPDNLRPGQEVEVGIKLERPVANTYMTLAAVDEGILQLSNFQSPNPADYFFGKRSLDIVNYDLYSMILPEVAPVSLNSPMAGDADEADIRRRNLNPVAVRRVKPIVFWSGLVQADRNGTARIKLKVPQFNGTLRFMAVAAADQSFGAVYQHVIVKEPVVLTPTFPRFVAGNDHFQAPVSVFNGTGKSGEFKIRLGVTGPVEIVNTAEQKLRLEAGAEKQVIFELKAKEGSGKVSFELLAQGNGAQTRMTEELSLRPALPVTHEISTGAITATRPLTQTSATLWLPGTAHHQLTLAPLPALRFARSLQYLLGYPHGCLEQTTSKLFPLLYFAQLAQAAEGEFFHNGNPGFYIQQGIEKLTAMQLWDGGFAYWPGGSSGNEWASVYAAHFLVEARCAGYEVTDRTYDRMLSFLTGVARTGDESSGRLQSRVYALYVLSLAGKPRLSDMTYFKNSRLESLSEFSRAQLAGAYFHSGDMATARILLPQTVNLGPRRRENGGNFNSAVRSDAIILGVLADVEPEHPAVFKLTERIGEQAVSGQWGTTQENAFALMALGKIYARKKNGGYQGEVLVDGKRLAVFDHQKPLTLTDLRLGTGHLEVRLTGDGECYYYLKHSGIAPDAPLLEYRRGISVTREFMDTRGNRVDLTRIAQGDLLVGHITVSTDRDELENVAVVDLLPAGLEIENPRLSSSAKLSWLNQKVIEPDYLDIRDDRLLLFASFPAEGTYHFYYAVRAVTCGEFILPAIKGECMYDPEISSIQSGGSLQIRR